MKLQREMHFIRTAVLNASYKDFSELLSLTETEMEEMACGEVKIPRAIKIKMKEIRKKEGCSSFLDFKEIILTSLLKDYKRLILKMNRKEWRRIMFQWDAIAYSKSRERFEIMKYPPDGDSSLINIYISNVGRYDHPVNSFRAQSLLDDNKKLKIHGCYLKYLKFPESDADIIIANEMKHALEHKNFKDNLNLILKPDPNPRLY